MDIRCKKCNKKYHIPDNQIEDKRVYFYCAECGQKVVINRKRIKLLAYKGLTSETLSAKDIFEGIYYSFNIKNVLLSFFILILFTILIALFSFIVYHNILFFKRYPFFSGFLFIILFIILTFIYDFHLYLISRNTFHRFRNDQNLKYSKITPEIAYDIIPVSFFSIGLLIIFIILFLPIFFSRIDVGMFYGGIFQSVFLIIASSLIFILCFKNIIYAFIAKKSMSIKNVFISIFRFIAIENVNIIIYMMSIYVILTFVSGIIIFFLFSGLVLIALMISPVVNSGSLSIKALLSSFSLDSLGKIPGQYSDASIALDKGLLLMLISTVLVLLFFTAYFINLKQVLSTTAVYIMDKNPVKSINRKVTAVIMILVFLIIVYYLLQSFVLI